jgi:hypothetical protein
MTGSVISNTEIFFPFLMGQEKRNSAFFYFILGPFEDNKNHLNIWCDQ